MTNDPGAVRAFAGEAGDLDNLAGIEVTAHLFQEWVDQAHGSG